ncbi:WD domain-containing protein [Phialemonium atrogriseum]|uniref:ASTRA-associated protein 1 n=1 Tax=Phialemonium atrogriseum TaxID=1093897 RepID=A0AAJ0BZ45_9PEZI|nr:WD domain-containing protein [Phialemonium atrogriseum]KAK1766921.1 WD domain-containing protein [Phialemonium atrogriseum]
MATTNSNSGRPLQPKSVLRGHKVQVHVATFIRRNARLVTGDADGFVIAWDLTIMRPRAIWHAHSNAILGIAGWGEDRIITHGRDNRLVVWKLGAQDEASLSTVLPLEPAHQERPQPWILHILEINTMNFCSFSSCPSSTEPTDLLISVPNTLASEAIDIYHLPSQKRIHTIRPPGDKNGMVMAVSLFHRQHELVLAAAYENGLAVVAQLNNQGKWELTYRAQVHTQPILSLDVTPDKTSFFTSGADAILARHPIPQLPQQATPIPTPATNPSPPTTAPPAPQPATPATPPVPDMQTQPLKVVDTRHAGQQGLRVRSDGRVLATAGWDSRARVYSARSMREVAVLGWHRVGCYAAAFSDVIVGGGPEEAPPPPPRSQSRSLSRAAGQEEEEEEDVPRDGGGGGGDVAVVVPRMVEVTARDRRVQQVGTAHWLAVGSKDGKVSLWDVF